MPEQTISNKPAAITQAISAIERYQQQASLKQSDVSIESYIVWLRKNLPVLAMNLAQKKGDIGVDVLMQHAEKGQTHMEAVLAEMKTQKVKPKQGALTYDAVVRAFPKKKYDRTELNRAIEENDPAKLKALIESGTDIHANNDAALRLASEKGSYDIVEMLITHGADIHTLDDVAFRLAAVNGHIDVVKLLIKNGANVHVLDGVTLHGVAHNGDYDIVKLLLDKGVSVHSGNDSALRLAAANGHYDVVALLIDKGANIHADDDSALRLAAENGHYNVVALLIDKGANIHAGGDYALRFAAANGYCDVVGLLLENNANIHADDDCALRIAAEKGHYDVVKLLLENNSNIHAYNDYPLRIAAQNGYYDVVELLIANDAHIHACGDDALCGAAVKGHLDIMKLLIKNGADIHVGGDVTLYKAAQNGHYDAVKLLIENGADIHTFNDSSILSAVKNGHYDVVDLLVQHAPSLEQKYLAKNETYTKYKTWKRLHKNFNPPRFLFDKNPNDFKLKTYLAVEAMLNTEGYNNQIGAKYTHNISTLFRTEDRVLRYLQKWGEAGKQPLHDCAQFIDIPVSGGIDYKAWGDAVLSQGPKMARLVKFADRLAQPAKSVDGKGWSLTKTKDQVAQFVYKDATKHPNLAAACFDFNWDEPEFNDAVKQVNKYKKLFAENDRKKVQGRIPDIKIDGAVFDKPDYHFYKLPDGDMRGLLLGEFTNCCQHLANAGADCAKHGFLSEQGGFYVVAHKKTDEIIGQSWAWRGEQDELVFDSLESLSGHFNAQNWEKITSELATQIKADNSAKISAFHIGKGGATPNLSFNKAAALAEPMDYDGYRDSCRTQYIVADFKMA